MKAFRLVLFFILLGTRMQTVRVVEQKISIRQEMDRILEKVPVHRADSRNRCRRMTFCESRWKEGEDWQERKGRTSHGERTQAPLKKTDRVETLKPQIETVRARTQEHLKKTAR